MSDSEEVEGEDANETRLTVVDSGLTGDMPNHLHVCVVEAL